MITLTNNWSYNLVRNIGLSVNALDRSAERLASGLRINRASDDPAGLVISEQMRSRIASLNQEIENTTGLLNKYRTADSAVVQMRRSLTELRTYAVAAANEGGLDEGARAAYQSAADNLVGSYNYMIDTTSFGTQVLLDGSSSAVVDLAKLESLDLSSAESAEAAISGIDEQIEQVDGQLAEIGSRQANEFESRLSNMRIEVQNLSAAESQIRDVDYLAEYASFIKNSLAVQAGVALLAHTSQTSQSLLSLLGSK